MQEGLIGGGLEARSNLDSVDLLKAVLSIFIVLIHVNPFAGGIKNCIYPVARVAVPVFFVISGYFFFSKLNGDRDHDRQRLCRFVKRNLQLYLFWFVVLLPLTLYRQHYFAGSFFDGILLIVKGFIFGSTFSASWYLMALVEGVLIIYFAGKKLSTKTVLFLAGVIQVVCCLASNYRGLFPADGILIKSISLYPGSVYISVLAGLWWLALGKYIAETENKKRGKGMKGLLIMLVIGTVALYVEQALIYRLDCSSANDAYFLLTPVVIPIFCCVKNWNIRIQRAEMLRAFSTITYCSHIAFGFIYGAIPHHVFNADINGAVFIVTLVSCFALTAVITRLEGKRHFNWLRYSH